MLPLCVPGGRWIPRETRPLAAARPQEPQDQVEVSGSPPAPLEPPGLLARTAEWTAGLAGSLWRLLVVGCELPSEPQPVEPVRKFSNPLLDGVLIQGERVYNQELEAQSIHTYAITAANELALLSFEQLRAAQGQPQQPPRRYRYVGSKTLTRSVNGAHAERARFITTRKAPAGERVVPKDSSLNPTAYAMYCDGSDEVSVRYVNQMAQIGEVEGYHVVAETPKASMPEVREVVDENVSLLPLAVNGEIWTEDYGERTLQGGVSVPAFIADQEFVPQEVYKDRLRRFYPGEPIPPVDDYEDLVLRKYPLAAFSSQGSVSQGNLQWGLMALAGSSKTSMRENLSHVEGGNALYGTLPSGEGYGLVGRDSLAVTRAKLSQDLGRPVSEKQALASIARDHGLKPGNLHPVEQPGEFHLDMRMMCVGPGEVVLNDAREAAAVQIAWLEQDLVDSRPRHPGPQSSVWQRMSYQSQRFFHRRRERSLESRSAALREEAERRALYEDMTLRDLQAAGMKVHRLAGVFVNPYRPEEDMYNFLNGRHGVNDANQRFFVGLGGDSRSEVYVARKLMVELPTGIRRVHFMDRELTPETLGLFGGIKCRTKPEGDLVDQRELNAPSPATLTV